MHQIVSYTFIIPTEIFLSQAGIKFAFEKGKKLARKTN